MFLRVRLTGIVLVMLGGCAVGPNYKGPPSAAPHAENGGGFRRGDTGPIIQVEPSDHWWLALNDPLLTKLIGRAIAQSPDIRAAEARVLQARANAHEQLANLLPNGSVTGGYLYNRIPLGEVQQGIQDVGNRFHSGSVGNAVAQRVPDTVGLDLYDTNFDATWEIDIFGGRRRGLERANRQAESAEAALADAHVRLAAQVAQAYVGLREAQKRLALIIESARLQQETLSLSEQRLALGTTSDVDVERLRTQLEQTQANVDPLRASVDGSLNQLAVLLGLEPGELDANLRNARAIPRPPSKVPIGDPAGVLRRRPDIRQAERSLAASNAQVGEAVANLFPRIVLFGNVGTISSSTAVFGTGGSLLADVGPTLQWNILDFGRNIAQIRSAQAGTSEAIAQYQRTVLSALQDAETALSRFAHQGSEVRKLESADAAARKAAELTRQRNTAGTVSVIDLLDVERQRLQTEQALVEAQGQLTNDYVSLQKALGLGWK